MDNEIWIHRSDFDKLRLAAEKNSVQGMMALVGSKSQIWLRNARKNKADVGKTAEGVAEGTVLRCVPPEDDEDQNADVFESMTSFEIIRHVPAGESVIVAGPTRMVEGEVMVPIEPDGAVQLDFFEVLWDADAKGGDTGEAASEKKGRTWGFRRSKGSKGSKDSKKDTA